MRAFTLSLFLLFGFLGVSLPAAADPPPWAPAHGWRAKHQHRYVYYPSHPIYYAPERRLWFWLHDGRWLSGLFLPLGLRHHLHGGVSLFYDSPYPYHYHHHTVRRFPRHHHHSGHRFNDRPHHWPGEWNYWDRDRRHDGHHDRDRDRHHGRGGHNSNYDRHRYQGRGDGHNGSHDGSRGRHDARNDGRHDGRRDHGGRRDGSRGRDHDRGQHAKPRTDRGPGSAFHRSPRTDSAKDGSARGGNRDRNRGGGKDKRG